jgi:parvulin-like peptidyl-prolyl isomerase
MRRNALLGKLAGRMVRITEDELRQAFGRRYQRKVVVRHMQLPSLPTAALTRKNLLSGVDFAALARQKSMGPSAADGGLLPPFGRDTAEVHPDLRDAAMSLERVGQISEILKIGKSFHLLKLEKIIEPEDVKFEDVRQQLARQVRAKRIEQLKQSILTRLFVEASRAGKIRFVDPTLRELSEQARNQGPTAPAGD